jgi:hypothetical protein
MVAGWNLGVFFLKAPVSHPPLSQFNRIFHKTNWLPLHLIPVLPGHSFTMQWTLWVSSHAIIVLTIPHHFQNGRSSIVTCWVDGVRIVAHNNNAYARVWWHGFILINVNLVIGTQDLYITNIWITSISILRIVMSVVRECMNLWMIRGQQGQ